MYLGHYHVAGFVLIGLVVLPVHRSSVSPTDSYSSESVESEISLSSSLLLSLLALFLGNDRPSGPEYWCMSCEKWPRISVFNIWHAAWTDGIWQPWLWEVVARLLGDVVFSVQWRNGLLQWSLFTVNDRTAVLLPATWPLDRNNYEFQLKTETEREATVFDNKKCQQCCENKSCCEAKSEVPASQ